MTTATGLPEFDLELRPRDRVIITMGAWRSQVGYLAKPFSLLINGEPHRFWRMTVINDISDDVFIVNLAEQLLIKSPYQGEELEPVEQI